MEAFVRYDPKQLARAYDSMLVIDAPWLFACVLSLYRRCDYRCVYCSTSMQGRSDPLVAPSELARELRVALEPIPVGVPVAVGLFRDAYTIADVELEMARTALEVLVEQGRPFRVVTKGTHVTRDVDLILAGGGAVTVSVSTLDAEREVGIEPGAAPAAERIEAANELAAAGVDVEVMVAPWIPDTTDVDRIRPLVDERASVKVGTLSTEGGTVWSNRFSRGWDQREVDRAYLTAFLGSTTTRSVLWEVPISLCDTFELKDLTLDPQRAEALLGLLDEVDYGPIDASEPVALTRRPGS